MKKILHVITSIKGGASASIKLSNAIIDNILLDHPDSIVHTFDLSKHPFPHLEESHITSFGTASEALTPENRVALKHSDEAIAAVLDADIIVIGVPIYNFNIPSTLKAWIDHIVRAGVTFKYIDGGPQGFVKNKKLYLAIASGAVYSEGPYKENDFTEPYLRTIFGFIGITDITTFRIEGTMVPGVLENAWPKALEAVKEYAF